MLVCNLMIKERKEVALIEGFFAHLSLYFCNLDMFFKLAVKLKGKLVESAVNTQCFKREVSCAVKIGPSL